MALDDRIVRIGIEIDGQIKYYEGLAITATGTKFANANQNCATVTIANLDKKTCDYILTETSPFNKNRSPKRLIIEAGRKSYGYTQIYIGDITKAKPSQPPDITLTIEAQTGASLKGKILARNQPSQMALRRIAKQVAEDNGLTLDFQATDKNIANYSYTGAALKQVDKLGESGLVNAYVDDNTLIVKDTNVPLTGKTRILNLDTGMIGIPDLDEQGLKVTFFIDNQTTLGSGLEVTSKINPAANGIYVIYKLSFNIASRDVPFYWIAECTRYE